MNYLEEVSIKTHNCWFVDLFVRPSNAIAVGFYRKLGYDVYRSVTGYYGSSSSGGEDAYDMRRAMPRDKDGTTSIPLNKSIMPHELEWR